MIEQGTPDVTVIIRAKLAAGTLPNARPSQIWAGEAAGDQVCDACDQGINAGAIEYEANILPGPGIFHFHRHCFDVWHQERARRLNPPPR